MKKLILLCVLILIGCTAEPQPVSIVEVPVVQPAEGSLIVEYIDLKLENERLIQELNNANARIGTLTEDYNEQYSLYKEKFNLAIGYRDTILYLLDYLPENQREIIFCDGWSGIVVHFLDTGRVENCLDVKKLVNYVYELDLRYPDYYPDFYQFPEFEYEDRPLICTDFCNNEIVEQDTYP